MFPTQSQLHGNREGGPVSVTPCYVPGLAALPPQPFLMSATMYRILSSPSTLPQIIYMVPSSNKAHRDVYAGHIHRCHLQAAFVTHTLVPGPQTHRQKLPTLAERRNGVEWNTSTQETWKLEECVPRVRQPGHRSPLPIH